MIIEKKADFLLGGGDYAQSTLLQSKGFKNRRITTRSVNTNNNQYNVMLRREYE